MSIRIKANDQIPGAFVVVPTASRATIVRQSVTVTIGAEPGAARRRVMQPTSAERARMGILARGIVRIFQRLMDRALSGSV